MTIDSHTVNDPCSGTIRLDAVADAILDGLEACLLVVGRDGTIRYRNAIAGSWLPDAADIESAMAEVRAVEPCETWSEELKRVVATGHMRNIAAAVRLPQRSSPSLVTVRCTAMRVPGSDEVSGAIVLIQEGEGQTAIEQQLEVSTRLASLGKMAASVAHELNNPLDGILRYTNLAMRLVDDATESKLKSYLTESRTGLNRMVQIIGDLLEYSRSTDGAFDAVNINETVEQAIRSTATAADANHVVVAADFQTAAMPMVTGTRLYQVCCNLLKNAIDAMPQGGRLSISTGVVDDQVVIRVADTGPGLPEPPDKVFEPFFTTKDPGKGTGLGLAICRDFIEDMSGTIEAASSAGAIFTVRIPIDSCLSSSPATESSGELDEPGSPPAPE